MTKMVKIELEAPEDLAEILADDSRHPEAVAALAAALRTKEAKSRD